MSLTPQEELRRFHLGKAIDFALEGLRSAILINGAAAIALLTFASNKVPISTALRPSLWAFGFGVLISTIAMLIAYIAQLLFADMTFTGLADAKRKNAEWWALALRWAGAAFFLAAMIAFILGICTASVAIFPSK